MNGLEVMAFCLCVGLQAGAIVWAAWTVDERRQKSLSDHTGGKSKSLKSNPAKPFFVGYVGRGTK